MSSAFGMARSAKVLLAPALLLLGVFFALPVVASFVLSFTNFDIYAIADLRNAQFVGLENYIALAHSPRFWHALVNTLYFAGVGAPLSILVALGAALLVTSPNLRLKGVFRMAYLAPFVTNLVAVAAVWRYLYHSRYGVVNAALGIIGVGPIDWFGNPHWAMPALILLATWRNFGFTMLVFIAGLERIPRELYEEAELEGAGPWTRLRSITIPLLRPTFVFVGVVTAIGFLQLFTEPYVMTNGGPLDSTESMVLYMYQEGFRWWRLGSAAAIAVVLFCVIVACTVLQPRTDRSALA